MCRKMTLQQRAKMAGTMDVILASINLITSGIDLNKLQLIKENPDTTEDEWNEAHAGLILLYIVITMAIMKLIMGIVLWKGATKRNYDRCLAWLIISLILWVILVVDFITKLVLGTWVLASTISTSFAILIRIAVMVVIFFFMKEIRSERTGVVSDTENVKDYGAVPTMTMASEAD